MSTTDTADSLQSGIARLQAGSDLPDEAPFPVHGIAIPDGAVTMGRSGVSRVWPSEALREAAPLLEDRPIVKNFHELDGQAPADDVIGQVTRAEFRDGLGLVFEGEITDREIAEKIANGFLEVSPVTFIAEETPDGSGEQFVVDEIGGFRDIAVVAEGAGRGNEINLGESAALAALSAEALSQAFAADPPADEDPDGEATQSDDGTPDKPPSQSTDGPADEPDDNQPSTQSMSEELSDDEKALLAAVDDPREAIEVLQDHDSREEPVIKEQTELDALEDTIGALEDNLAEVEEPLRAALQERTGLSEAAVDDLSHEALTAEFRNDEGDIEVDALSQMPETQEPETEALGDEAEEVLDELGYDDRDEAVEALQSKREQLESGGWDGRPLQRVETQLSALGVEV